MTQGITLLPRRVMICYMVISQPTPILPSVARSKTFMKDSHEVSAKVDAPKTTNLSWLYYF